jgi:hypothetical protein
MRISTPDEPSANASRCAWRFGVLEPYIHAGSIGAELGVFKGSFIEYFLSKQPRTLYAVDPWYLLSAEWPWAVGDKCTVRALLNILEEYQPEIARRQLIPRIEFSETFLVSLPDQTLDWVYIDSSHSYEGTKYELALCINKVKKGGYIMGDDFNNDPQSKHYGVYKAVQEYVTSHRLELLVDGTNRQFVALNQ